MSLRISSWTPVKRAWLNHMRDTSRIKWNGFSLTERVYGTISPASGGKTKQESKLQSFPANDSAAVCCRNKPFKHGRSAGWRHLNSTRHFALWCIERGYSEATRLLFGEDNEPLRNALTEAEILGVVRREGNLVFIDNDSTYSAVMVGPSNPGASVSVRVVK